MYTGTIDLADMHNAPTIAQGNLMTAAGSFTTATGARGGRAGRGAPPAGAPVPARGWRAGAAGLSV